MATSQNKYAVLTTNRTTGALPRLRRFYVGTERVYLRDGSAGFLLAHVAHWFNENIEQVVGQILDDWGWAVRPVRGQSTGYSNHASGTAIDINATQHPRGKPASATFSATEITKIHKQLEAYDGCIRWGGDYTSPSQPDGMHFEINDDLAHAEAVARKLWQSKHGKPVIDANPGLADVIWDGNVPGPHKPPPDPKPVSTGAMFDLSYAKNKVTPEVIAAAVKAEMRGCGRYLSGNSAKDLSKAEIARLHKGGLWVLPVFERKAGEALGGMAAGGSMRAAAEGQAKQLDIPVEDAVVYAVDQAVTTTAQREALVECFEALNEDNEYPVGVYGSADVLDLLGDKKLATAFWQTTAWSGGRVSKYAQILQVTTHSRSIKGLERTDWDENVILPGRPAIPVWNPGEPGRSAHKPPPPPPPPPPPVPDSPTWVVTQANVQQTDSLKDILSRIHAVADGTSAGAVPPDVVVWNEIGGKHQAQLHDAIHALPGFASYTVEGVGISWRTSVFHDVGRGGRVVNPGVAHLTPDRPLIYVDLQHLAAQKMYRQEAGHSVHHVDVGGLPRIKGALLGQNRRARRYFAAIAADLKAAKVASLPCVFEGDLNVDLLAEKHLPPSKRCQWFPLTVLGAVARIRMPLHGTHGGRAIDWNVVAGAVYVLDNEVLPHGTSDHNPVQHTLTFDRSLTGVEPSL